MSIIKKTKFEIQRLDRFAQGVHFGDKTTFIERALPEEKGEAVVTRSAKGVDFAQIQSVEGESVSSLRVEPDCEHYKQCKGCHYRHVDYATELEFKKESFSFELRNYTRKSDIETLSLSRNYYRNRLQLHYNKKLKKIGFINKQSNQILQVPHCMLGNLILVEKLKELYLNQKWLKLANDQRPKGHLEIYEKNGSVSLEWNKPYAHGGFSQVNTKLNQKLHLWIKKHITQECGYPFVLDLFGGEGNLSESIEYKERVVVDLYSDEQENRLGDNFVHLDLEKASADDLGDVSPKVDLMIIDPPRRGFTKIDEWVNQFSPEKILYVSCDVGSLKRDLKKITSSCPDYKVDKTLMIDFFGGTYHYESLVFLSKTII